MAKRFTDVDKWRTNAWFRKLSMEYKFFWMYLCEVCDSVGVWEVDLEFAAYQTGIELDEDDIMKHFGDRIHVFNGKHRSKKWWIVDFIKFQYGFLDEDTHSKPHLSYIALLKDHDLWGEYQRVSKGYTKGIHTLKEKDKETETEKEKEKDEYSKEFEEWWETYGKVGNKNKAFRCYKSTKKKGASKDDLAKAAVHYRRFKGTTDTEYFLHGATFLGPDEHWRDYLSLSKSSQETMDDHATKRTQTQLDELRKFREEVDAERVKSAQPDDAHEQSQVNDIPF